MAMSEPFDRRLFEQIFSDAHVIDLDFSQWDKFVSLCVVADHIDVSTSSRLPLFLVHFQRVSKFFLTFNHLEVTLKDADKHFQWNIDDFRIKKTKDRFVISLFGSANWPHLIVECQDILFRRISNAVLDSLFPGWNAPYKGLVRPGIETFREEKRKRKKK